MLSNTHMKQRILVVDDEEPIRELLSTYFAGHEYEVTTAATVPETVNSIQETIPDLVILDIALADADGLELLGTLKASHPKLPIIILTGMGFDEELLQEALQKGADGYVSKTLPLDQLLKEVMRTLKNKWTAT